MIFRRYKLILFFIFFFTLTFVQKAEATDVFDFKIQNDITTFLSSSATSTNVDDVNRTITLPKQPLSDVVKFTKDGTYDYAVLTKDGLKQYMFDGTKEVPINALSIPINDPLAMAVSQESNGYTSYSIAQLNSSNNTFDIKNYQNNGVSLVENPALSVSGLQSVFSITNTSKSLAVLTDKDMKLFSPGSTGMVEIPQLGLPSVQNPLALASSVDDGYNVVILEKDKTEYYTFNGTSLMNIPALDVTLDPTVKNPKGIAINGNSTSILYDSQISNYQLNTSTQQMEFHAALSITSGLVKPQAFAIRKGSNDIVVIDEVDSVNKIYRAKYFMFDGSKMVEVQSLENDIPNISTADRYMQKAEVVSNVLMTQAQYADYVRVRAYTETPTGTAITFYVANAGDDPSTANWQESWKVENPDGSNTGTVYKYVTVDSLGNKGYQEYGTPSEAYPSFDSKSAYNTNLTNSDIQVTTDANGNPIINSQTTVENQLLNLWTSIPIADKTAAQTSGQYKKVRVKAVLTTTDPSVTPMIFAPIRTNNTQGIYNSDDTAIRVDAGTQPNTPVINPIAGVDGWVYTTTPTITWQYNNVDQAVQNGSQILVLAKKSTGWEIAYNSQEVTGDAGKLTSFKIPTSDKPDVDGPLYASNSYQFAVFVRTWSASNIASDFSTGVQFNVLAFERPRIAQIINAPTSINPVLTDPTTHFMILPGMTKDQLPVTKAGAQVTFILDSVGPIMTDPNTIPKFYATINGTDYPMNLGSCQSTNTPGDTVNNRWVFNFWTDAPITSIPNDTVVKANFIGTGTVGGTTEYDFPPIAEGVIKTSDTIYTDWQVTLQGSTK